jgi:hypothetical protein
MPGITTLITESDSEAERVECTDEHLIVHLADGRTLMAPLEWYPRLLHATPEERAHYVLFGDGYSIHWPDLDEDIGIEGLFAGRRSGESEPSIQRWLKSRGLAPSGE